jgi:hypothetical protein
MITPENIAELQEQSTDHLQQELAGLTARFETSWACSLIDIRQDHWPEIHKPIGNETQSQYSTTLNKPMIVREMLSWEVLQMTVKLLIEKSGKKAMTRKTLDEAQVACGNKKLESETKKHAFKVATLTLSKEPKKTDGLNLVQVCTAVNETFGTSLLPKQIWNNLNAGKICVSPVQQDPKGYIPDLTSSSSPQPWKHTQSSVRLEELVFQTARNSSKLPMLWRTQKKVHLPGAKMIHLSIGFFKRKCHQIS